MNFKEKLKVCKSRGLCASIAVIAFFQLALGLPIYTQASVGGVLSTGILTESLQQAEINGRVVDSLDQPINGVSITVKNNPDRTTQTNFDGTYTINASKGDVLVFSMVGYISQEVTVNDQASVHLVLRTDATGIDEVVVVGYGTQRKGLVTGSISSVKGGDIVRSPSLNVGQSLQGRISGVIMNVRSGEPGADGASINIRGRSTTGNTDPLIIIDGIPNRAGNWDRINPNDIESVTVLKDASAAIYGSRSANGVILITTKRGVTGKPTINYTFNQGFQRPTRLPKLADAKTFAEVFNEIEVAAGRSPRYTEEEIIKFGDGSDPLRYPNTNWLTETFRRSAPQQNHNLSVRGGSENVKYFIGGGYSDQDAIYKNSATNFQQYNIRSNIDAQITNSLKVSVDLEGRIEDRNYGGFDTGSIFFMLMRAFPTSLARYSNGLPAVGMDMGNPVTLVTDETGYRRYKKSVFNSVFTANLDLSWLTEGLTIDGFAAFDREGSERKEWYTPYYHYIYDEQTDTYDRRKNGTRDFASLRQDYIPRQSLTLNTKINYRRTFDAAHGLDLMLGYEQNELKGNDFWGSRSNYLSTAIDQLFAGSTNRQFFNNGGSAFEQARQSVFGRFGYDYKAKYMAQFNFRYDGSYIFAADKRWGFFPGISLGWRISEENFIKDHVDHVNLKLKGSYGQQGNDNVGAFQYLLNYATGRNYVFGNTDVQGVFQEGFPNRDITWEVANTYNVGVEGDFWNGKLGFELELFKTVRSNILRTRNASIPQYTGLKDLPDENIGRVQNQGVEFQLNHRSKIGAVNFHASGNFLFARNKVIYVDETPWGEGYDYLKEEGRPIGAPLYYNAIGVFRDQADLDAYPHFAGAQPGDLIFRDVDGNGVINSLDMVRNDLTNFPEIVFGMTLGASWKSFDTNVLLQGQARAVQNVYTRVAQTGNFFMVNALDRWTPENIDGSLPRAEGIHNAYAHDFFLRNTSFLRLKNLEVGYSLPEKITSKIGFSTCRVYLSGHNLLTFDRIKVMDPESNSSSANYYPQVSIYNAGINLTF